MDEPCARGFCRRIRRDSAAASRHGMRAKISAAHAAASVSSCVWRSSQSIRRRDMEFARATEPVASRSSATSSTRSAPLCLPLSKMSVMEPVVINSPSGGIGL